MSPLAGIHGPHRLLLISPLLAGQLCMLKWCIQQFSSRAEALSGHTVVSHHRWAPAPLLSMFGEEILKNCYLNLCLYTSIISVYNCTRMQRILEDMGSQKHNLMEIKKQSKIMFKMLLIFSYAFLQLELNF